MRFTAIASGLARMSVGDVRGAAEGLSNEKLGRVADPYGVLQEYLREIVGALARLGSGDLTTAVTPRSADDELGHALANMTESLRTLVKGPTRAVTELRYAVPQLSEATPGGPSGHAGHLIVQRASDPRRAGPGAWRHGNQRRHLSLDGVDRKNRGGKPRASSVSSRSGDNRQPSVRGACQHCPARPAVGASGWRRLAAPP